MSASTVGKTCLKCGHQRSGSDPGPDYGCPHCGAVYAKVEAVQQARLATQRAVPPPKYRPPEQVEEEARDDKLRLYAIVLYCLMGLAPLTMVIALPIAYIMKGLARGSYVLSHFRAQIFIFKRTLALVFLCAVVNGALVLATLKYGSRDYAGWAELAVASLAFPVLMFVVQLWCWYRLIRGLSQLSHGEHAT